MRQWIARERGVLLAFVVGGLGVWLAPFLHIPGGSFTGAMLATGAANLALGGLRDAPKGMQMVARVVLGLSIGASVTHETLAAIARSFVPVVAMVVAVALLGMLAAWAISRTTGMKLPTALCAASPGALPAMVALSRELGGEAPVVATMHLIRLISILLVIPTLAITWFPADTSHLASAIPMETASMPYSPLVTVSLLLALGLVAGLLARRLKLPAGDLLMPMFVAAIVNPGWLHVAPFPPALRLFANWVIGIGVGTSITMEELRRFRPYALAGTLMTAFLLLSGLGLGWLLARLTEIDLLTALLGCAPGGATAIMVISGDLGADAQLVASMHVTRMILLMALLPMLIRLAERRISRGAAERLTVH
ncbi:MAG: AbrB family transcriptional regulator [Anaerolineae bacterium]|nr:AbrB family transcriptional regulator [Chloroflexota bacterium]